MKKTIRSLCLILALILVTRVSAQMSGSYAVPGTISSLATAINSLNTLGVSGSVTIDVAAGYTETVSVGGLTLNAIVGASATNSIVIQKSGSAANPILYAYAGGTATPASAIQDGIFRLNGADYITIDGIDLNDPNAANPATMEFGYGLFRASATDGCQNNVIKNCAITLNRINNVAGSGPSSDGSRGIDVVDATIPAHTTALSITSAAGANSNNKFYSNNIQNCNIGIALIGFADVTPFTFADAGNDVGGTATSTGNMILNYGGGTAGTTDIAGVRTAAQYGLNISYNTINNNNGSGATHSVIVRGIFINAATSANTSVNSNTITLLGIGNSQLMQGINNAAGSTAAGNTIDINNNLITNCIYTVNATSAVFNAILNSGTPLNLNINGNMISNIQLKSTGASVMIETGSPTNATANTNTITNITNATSSTGGSMRLLKTTSPTNLVVNNNLLDGASYLTAGSSGLIDGFYSLSSAVNVSVTNNIIRNFSVPGTAVINGIREFGVAGNKVIQNNTIYSFSTTAGGVGGGGFNGIFASAGTLTITGNLIYSLNTTGSTGGTGGALNGIQVSGGVASNVYKNKIYDISSTSTGPVVSGITISGGTSNMVFNNLVGDLRATVATGVNRVIGLNLTGGTSNYVYHNSVYLNATSTGAAFGSAAIHAGTAGTLDLRNNIFVNNSTPTGAGLTLAYSRSSNAITTYSQSSNNNLFYAGTPSANNLIYFDGTFSLQTLSAYKALPFLNNRDAFSVTENPTFVSTVGSNANFLNISTSIPTQIESGGLPSTGVTDDYAGTVRNVTTPDLGAWEGTYVFTDVAGPVLLASSFSTPPCTLSGRTFTASLADPAGVATGGLAPRVYYKVNAGAYTSVAGTLASGTATNGVWSFNLVYTAAVNDVISFYLVAQDAYSPANLVSFPSGGFAGTDVNTVTTPPTTPSSFPINNLNGVYTVGAAGTFTSLTAAAYAYNNYCLTGPVTFSLVDALYSTAETFPIVFRNFNGQATATNSLLIIPQTGLAVSITPTNTSINSVIKFLDAKYITIDGLNTGGSSITFNNSNVSTVSADIWLSSSNNVGSGNNFIAIKNSILKGGYNTGSNGVIASIDGLVPSGTAGMDNDNITIMGNNLQTFYQGVLAVGSASVSAGGLDNWVIDNNTMGAATSGPTDLGANGVVILNALNLSVKGNLIRNINTGGSGVGAINLNGNVNVATVSQNTLTSLTSSIASSGISAINGIYLGPGVITTTVNANQITGVFNTNTSGYGARGIIVNTGDAAGIRVSNNMISDISCYSDPSAAYWPIGIALEGLSGGINVDYNSINLFGGHPGLSSSTSSTGAAPLYLNNTGVNTVIRNNILSNTYDNSSSPIDFSYAIYSAQSATNISVMNYNDYYVGGAANSLVLGYLTANQNNLAAIQTAFGGNLNSKNVQPLFVSNTDLHMQLVIGNLALHNTATPLAGITTDFDAQTRSLTVPDIGADEFSLPVCTAASGGVLSATSVTACAGQTLVATSTGASTGLTATYLWKVGATPTGPYVPVTGGTGSTTTSYTSAPLPAGVYYVVLETTCGAATLTGISNEATLTVNAAPTASASSTSTSICQGANLNLTGASSTGTAYAWAGPNSFISLTQNPTITGATPAASGIYSLITNFGACPSTVAVISVTVHATPSPVLISPATPTLCAGVTETLTATGAYGTYSWTPATGLSATTGNTVGATLSSATIYTVVSTNSACTASTTISINVTPQPTVSIASTATAVCVGGTVNLTASGANTYSWNNTQTSTVITVTVNATTGYTVTGQNQSCPGVAASMSVIANPLPTVSAVASSPTVCAGYVTTLTASGANTYSWSTTSTATVITVMPMTNMVYTVTGITALGCKADKTVAVTANPLPVVSITPASPTICTNESVILTAAGGTAYAWTPTSTGSTLSVNPSATTSYTVEGTDVNNCKNTATVSVVVDPCTGVREQNTVSGNVNLYPNPSTGRIIADFGFEGSKEIIVLNSVGAFIMKASTEEQSTTLDLSGYSKGVYFVNVKANGASANYKIVIE